MHIHTRGFTIVELIIVIVVISLLATIVTVSYQGSQDKTYDTSIKNDLKNIYDAMELARANNNSTSYPYTNPDLVTMLPDLRVNKNAYVTSPDAYFNILFCWPSTTDHTSYKLLAYSISGTRLYIDNTGVITEYTGATSWAGSDPTAICAGLTSGWVASGAGYAAPDTTTGPWRDWTSAS